MTNAVHPATSAAFLSRLHDAELSPAEAIDFDRHRADCESCREAVAQFERSLAAFRTAPTTQVPSDLSARILRKIRAQSPSRRPFGVTFGIDIRWAGVFMAALLVAIIAPALLFKDEARHPAPAPEPISAYVVEAEPDSKAAAPRAPAPARPRSRDVAQAPAAKPEMKAPVDETRADSRAVMAEAPLPAESEEFAARRNAARPLSAAPPAAAKREAPSRGPAGRPAPRTPTSSALRKSN